jgi:hypothetical protein
VQQQRLVVDDQVLVEAETAGSIRDIDRRIDTVGAVGDLVDVGAGLRVGTRRCNDRPFR